MRSVGLVTTAADAARADAPDAASITEALREHGIEARPVRWHDSAPVDVELLVMRSPWDYTERLPEFLDWLARAASERPVLNAPELIRWNLDKRYLLELTELGVPVVPTTVCAGVEETARAAGAYGGTVVVKPTVSAGSRDTALLPADSADVAPLAARILAQDKLVLVQPAVDSVGVDGELACLFFDGEFSHAVRKGPILAPGGGLLGGDYREHITPADPSPDVLALGRATLDAVGTVCTSRLGVSGPPLYARIDVVAGPSGPLLLEAELFEPSYFLASAVGSADRFAEAVARRLGA